MSSEPQSIDEILAPFWRTDDGRTAAERAAAYGIDLSLIEENLRLTPEERAKEHELALQEAEQLVAAYERTHPHFATSR